MTYPLHSPNPTVMPFKDKTPTIGRDVFIAPTAAIIGDVRLGDRSNIWFNCVLRGDDHYIEVGADTNIQDGSVVHVFAETYPTIIGERVTVGHGVMLHGCRLEDDCMVGIGAKVLDGAVVERGAVVAAGSVVSPGKVVKAGQMWAGVPARFAREIKPVEKGFIEANSGHYHRNLALEYLKQGA